MTGWRTRVLLAAAGSLSLCWHTAPGAAWMQELLLWSWTGMIVVSDISTSPFGLHQYGQQSRVNYRRTTSMWESPLVHQVHDWVPLWAADLLRIQALLWPEEFVGFVQRLRQDHVHHVRYERRKFIGLFLLANVARCDLLMSIVWVYAFVSLKMCEVLSMNINVIGFL